MYIAVNVRFRRSIYRVFERRKIKQQFNLILSNPSSTDITILVQTSDDTAIGIDILFWVISYYGIIQVVMIIIVGHITSLFQLE